jgi:glutamate/tyrosine decarboxylase-like PLP-dependent enzyme
MDSRESALQAAHDRAIAFLASLDDRPVWPRASYDEMLAALGGPLPRAGTDAAKVVDELAQAADPGLDAMPGGRFFGFVIGGALPAALGADWLTSAWDQNAGLTAASPASSAAETAAGRWLLELLGLPPESAVGFVTGGMMANYSCLAAARHAVLDRAGWDLRERGMFGAPAIRLVVGSDRHDTVDRAAQFLGLGRRQVGVVEADHQGRMVPPSLDAVLAADDGPTIVCLQAGEVHTGDFDPFESLIMTARRHGAWVHVDGAFGLWAAAAASTRHLVAGIEAADSWATDAHKTLNVPYDSGLAIVRDRTWTHAAFGVHADYLIADVDDPLERTPEFSRRARGFPVWAALRSLGAEGVAALVEKLCRHARLLAAGLLDIPGVDVLNEVVFTQVMFRLGDDDEATRRLGQDLLADGVCVVTPAAWRGRAAQRCSLSSWATTDDDIDRTLDAVRRIAARIPATP